jgi:hypothetical protein
VSDCRKRPCTIQIKSAAWVLHGQITVDDLHALSHSMVVDPEDDIDNESEISKMNRYLQILFGAQFEKLFGKMHENVKYFVIFCNLVNILDVGADTSKHAAKGVNTEIRGFLQLRSAVAETALQKLLHPFAPQLSSCWARCEGGLFGHAGYTECLRLASTWFKLHHTCEFESNNQGKIQAKARHLATLKSSTFAMLCCFLHFGIHDNRPACLNESLRRYNHSDDQINGFIVVFPDRWSESIACRIRKTDLPSAQSTADSMTCSSFAAAAARSSS